MLKNIFSKIFKPKSQRDVQKFLPIVKQINEVYETLHDLTDEQLRGKTDEFKNRLSKGETLDDLLPEAFAVVKEACRRHVGKSWQVRGIEQTWNMIPYDVQLIGGIALHKGMIAEMATGEGKTLVATMPLYLNALTGKGVHLVTVNDYLAQRDAEWMGKIYEFLGLSVGVIITNMEPQQRRENYNKDITYGTNNEFGFDYLRDNMAISKEDVVQRGFFYAIIDEVDSVLIDEARTPLIISGPVPQSTHKYYELKPAVERLVNQQTILVNKFVHQARELLNKDNPSDKDIYRAGELLLMVQRGAPKNKQLMKLLKEPDIKKLVTKVENDYLRDKKMHLLDENLYFVIDERANTSDLMEMGREKLSPKDDPEYFVLPNIEEELSMLETANIPEEDKIKKREKLMKNYAEKSERLHNISNLLKAYALFEKDVEYIVQDNKVIIVDEFTGRLMPGRRFSDGLHQALEAKEGVRIERETQTFATITLQNYFRMYEKLAGMTGTAITEEQEFWEIYKLSVMTIPTNKPIRRVDYNDAVYRTKREKYNAIVQEVIRLHKQKQPVLVGTVSVEVSEILSRLLKRAHIPHNVLNAKHHQKEAEIVSRAGQPGAVTIATNMAGRGTDIKLGEGVVKCKECCINSKEKNWQGECVADPKECKKNVPCGLHIIGSERHESRRIDRQLRGRSGRQGDPGSSRFFVSLEDDLMRLFGSDRYTNVIKRLNLEDGERIEHPWITKSIERAQKMVEARNFEIRKHLLEYDNVMNQQRSIIYKKRREILFSEDLTNFIQETIENVIWDKIEIYTDPKSYADEWDIASLESELFNIFSYPFKINLDDFEEINQEKLAEYLIKKANDLYSKYTLIIPPDKRVEIERMILLGTIDNLWREHLYAIDSLKESIGLRAYGQKDPIIEYKKESYNMFQELVQKIDEISLKNFFRLEIEIEAAPTHMEYEHQNGLVYDMSHVAQSQIANQEIQQQQQAQQQIVTPKLQPIRRQQPKVGPNDPCPCGSGKKYKKCCGRITK